MSKHVDPNVARLVLGLDERLDSPADQADGRYPCVVAVLEIAQRGMARRPIEADHGTGKVVGRQPCLDATVTRVDLFNRIVVAVHEEQQIASRTLFGVRRRWRK